MKRLKEFAPQGVLYLYYEDWLEYRRAGIGGSDASVVCGVNRYKSPIELFMEKTGIFPHTEAGEAAYWGQQLEAALSSNGFISVSKSKNSRNVTFRAFNSFSKVSFEGFFIPRSTPPKKDTLMPELNTSASCVSPACFRY
jgi:predicted phage-related endonuclease